jgi:hypothetical protein
MLSLPLPVKIFWCLAPTDMRKSFDGLSALVSEHLRQDPLSGHLFIFTSRRRDRVKLLYFERGGLAIWYKTLESQRPHSFLFTEFGRARDNLTRRPIAVGGMDSVSTRNGPRRRPVHNQIAVPAPPRAQFAANPETPPNCGVG